jgi:hypothetical protein
MPTLRRWWLVAGALIKRHLLVVGNLFRRLPRGRRNKFHATTGRDKAYEQKDFSELADLPIDALQGVSKADAEAIQKAFNVRSIRQLAQHKFIRAAHALTLLAGAK